MQEEVLFEKMVTIRLFEEAMEGLFSKGVLFGTTHSCAGQEAVAVGVTSALENTDIVTSNHRGHGHYISFTDDVYGLVAEIMGKESGVCAGRGGSQHLCKGNFYSNGITAGMVPVATGMAFAEKLKNTKNIVVCFFGDGALGEGVLYESMNMASIWGLPIIYVVENNQYAMSTHISNVIAGEMVVRGKAFGIESIEISTSDVVEIYEQFKRTVNEIRQTSKPKFFVFHTYRLSGHSKSDNCSYRTKEEESQWRMKDPLVVMQKKLDSSLTKTIYEKCTERIHKAIEQAHNSKFPDQQSLMQHLFQS